MTFTVTNSRGVASKSLFALVDVEMQVGGVSVMILGVQARRAANDCTSVHLPTFKDADGTWRPAIRLPEEVRAPLANAVLDFLIEAGLAKRKFLPA
jgi:stage V sporulation protein G